MTSTRFKAMLISCIVAMLLSTFGAVSYADLIDPLILPLISQSGPGPVVWRNPATLARSESIRLWVGAGFDNRSTDVSSKRAGFSVPLGFGLPLFCTSDIPPLARKAGIDPSLAAALVAVESSFNPRAVSKPGARGLTQLTSRTARSLGVYNRHWPRWNLWGGFTYLAQLQKRFGDDDLALAAYNVGPTRVGRKGNAALQDPAVAKYVSSIQTLRKAYSKRYPRGCTTGGNTVAIAWVEQNEENLVAAGWGLDIQAIMELGVGIIFRTGKDSTSHDPMIGTRLYIIDPMFLAGTYHWESSGWEAGALFALRGEKILVGIESNDSGQIAAGVKHALPLGLGFEVRWRDDALALALSAESQMWNLSLTQRILEPTDDGKREINYSLLLSLGKTPSL